MMRSGSKWASRRRAPIWMLGAAAIVSLARAAFAAQSAEQQAPSEIRTSPIYATAGDGTPVTALGADDLEVKLGGRLISDFTLIKGESPNKLVFIILDTASLDSNMLQKSKKIALSMIDRAAGGVRFVVMSIDPGLGLKPVCDLTADKRIVSKSVDESVTSKGIVYLRNRATTGRGADLMEDRRFGTVILTSLRTLNAALAKFPESNKVVHFYSGGIPQGPMLDRSPTKRYTYLGAETLPVTQYQDLDNFTSPSTETYDKIMGAGRAIKKSGVVLFAIFPYNHPFPHRPRVARLSARPTRVRASRRFACWSRRAAAGSSRGRTRTSSAPCPRPSRAITSSSLASPSRSGARAYLSRSAPRTALSGCRAPASCPQRARRSREDRPPT